MPGLAGECEPSEALRGPLSPFIHPLMSLSSFLKPSDVQVELGVRHAHTERQGEGAQCLLLRQLDSLSVNVLSLLLHKNILLPAQHTAPNTET